MPIVLRGEELRVALGIVLCERALVYDVLHGLTLLSSVLQSPVL
jgi:RNase P/RNase MRP subunit POP5